MCESGTSRLEVLGCSARTGKSAVTCTWSSLGATEKREGFSVERGSLSIWKGLLFVTLA